MPALLPGDGPDAELPVTSMPLPPGIRLFPRETRVEVSSEEVINIIDRDCTGVLMVLPVSQRAEILLFSPLDAQYSLEPPLRTYTR